MSFDKFYFRPGAGEHIEARIILSRDEDAAISGYVTDGEGHAAERALASLYDAGDGGENTLLARCFTDSDGRFQFGPLISGRLYLIRVGRDAARFRAIEAGERLEIRE